jgi:hypothetical protein
MVGHGAPAPSEVEISGQCGGGGLVKGHEPDLVEFRLADHEAVARDVTES